MSNPVRLLFIASRADIAGGENYLLHVFRYMDRERFEPLVAVPEPGPLKDALDELDISNRSMDVDYGWLEPPLPWFEFLEQMQDRVRRLVGWIEESDIRLVHTNSNMILEGAFAARLAGIPHLFLAHLEFQDNLPIYQRVPLHAGSFAELMSDLSAGIVAVSTAVRDSYCPPLHPQQIRVIHNGIEPSEFNAAASLERGSILQELSLPTEAVLVTVAARLTEDKGIDVFLESVATIYAEFSDSHFLIAGGTDSDAYRKSIEEQIHRFDETGRVHLLGFRSDLPQLLAASDIFVLSSRREGHPYVLLEAMASECAVVATRCGGVEDTVMDGRDGLLVDIEDSDGLAEALRALLGDTERRQTLAKQAKERVLTEFTAERSAMQLFEVYQDLLGKESIKGGRYAVDGFLQAAREIGVMGRRLTQLEERFKRTERAADLLLENPLMRSMRHIKHWLRGRS